MTLPTTPALNVEGQRALVTGASRGIGMGAAVALAGAGAHVVLAARSTDALATVVQGIEERGGSAQSLTLDVTDREQVQAMVAEQQAFDILVNNAGANRPGPLGDVSVEDYEHVMDLNVKAAFFVAQAITGKMIKRGQGGVVINTSSQMGHVGGIDRSIYCASKFAVEGMSRAMAIELAAHNIRVNTICPTFIATPFTAATLADPEKVAWIESKIKLGRIGEIEDIMGAVVFLASPAASLITGTSLLIDGGWTAG